MRPQSMRRDSRPVASDEQRSMPAAVTVEQRFSAVLRDSLTPPELQQQLIESQSLEQKWQYVLVHQKSEVLSWGPQQAHLLQSLTNIDAVLTLKTYLCSPSPIILQAFLDAQGVPALLQTIQHYISAASTSTMNEFVAASLYEVLICCKLCLWWEYKPLALQVLEILSACCYDEESTLKVFQSFAAMKQVYEEDMYVHFATALLTQDVEVKSAILQLILSLIDGANGNEDLTEQIRRQVFHAHLPEKGKEALQQIEREWEILGPNNHQSREESRKGGEASPPPRVLLRSASASRSLMSFLALKGLQEGAEDGHLPSLENRHSMNRNSMNPSVTRQLSIARNRELAKQNLQHNGEKAGFIVFPRQMTSCLTNISGEYKYCELDNHSFRVYHGQQPNDRTLEEELLIAEIVEVSMDLNPQSMEVRDPLTKLCQQESYIPLLLRTKDRQVAFACVDEQQRYEWLDAIQASRHHYVISRSSFYMSRTYLTYKTALHGITVYRQAFEQLMGIIKTWQQSLASQLGFDFENVQEVFSFLVKQMVVHGHDQEFLQFLQAVVALPSGLQGELTWKTLRQYLRSIHEVYDLETAEDGTENSDGEDLTRRVYARVGSPSLNVSLVRLLKQKAEDEGNQYQHMSKLAFQATKAELEARRLQRRVTELESQHFRQPSRHFTAAAAVLVTNAEGEERGETDMTSLTTQLQEMQAGKMLDAQEMQRLRARIEKLEAEVAMSSHPMEEDKQKLRSSVDVSEMMPRPPSPDSITSPMKRKATFASIVQETEEDLAQRAKFGKYMTMVNDMPEDAVRQRMRLDGWMEQEIEAFLRKNAPATTTQRDTPQESVVPMDEKFKKYVKMKQLLPEPAVRQRMRIEGCSESEIDAFLAGEPLPPAPSVPAQNAETAKYDKMMRAGLPEGAVRQRMGVDGLREEQIDAYFSAQHRAVTATGLVTADGGEKTQEQVDISKYEVMLKRGLPEGAVRHRMIADSVAPADIQRLFPQQDAPTLKTNDNLNQANEKFSKYVKMKQILPEAAVRQRMRVDGCTDAEIEMFITGQAPPPTAPSAAVDEKFSKYVKMKQILPEAAVRQRMRVDGCTDAEIEMFITGQAPPAMAAIAADTKTNASKKKLRNLHWTPFPTIAGTIWAALPAPVVTVATAAPAADDVAAMALSPTRQVALEEWFAVKETGKKATGATTQPPAGGATAAKKPVMTCLDGKRIQNLLIFLGKLRKSPEQIIQMIYDVQPEILGVELTNALLSLYPSDEEMTTLKQWLHKLQQEHPQETLATIVKQMDAAHGFVYHLSRLPRGQVRLQCHEITLTFATQLQNLSTQMQIVSTAIEELRGSQVSLAKLLAVVLSIGNYLNAGSRYGQVAGVKVDILNKLVQMKANPLTKSSQVNSLLHFIVMLLEEKRQKEVLDVPDQWTAVLAAAEINMKEVAASLFDAQKQLTFVQTEHQHFLNQKYSYSRDETPQSPTSHRSNPLAHHLHTFLLDAQPHYLQVENTYKQLTLHLQEIMSFYGEEYHNPTTGSSGDDCQQFFATFADFSRTWRKVRADVEKQRQLLEKAAAKAAAKERRSGLETQTKPGKRTEMKETESQRMAENIFGRYYQRQQQRQQHQLAQAQHQVKLMTKTVRALAGKE